MALLAPQYFLCHATRSSRVMLLIVASVGSATIGESSPYTSRSNVRVATVPMFRFRLRMPGIMPCFSRCSRSAGNAGLFRRSSQIFSPSST